MKAQASLEFLAMTGFAGITLIILVGVAYNLSYDQVVTSTEERVTDFGSWVQEEIILASRVHEGYEREINLPKDINGIPYSVSISGNTLYVTYSEGDIPFPIPPVSGSINKGDITIRNVGGNVQVS